MSQAQTIQNAASYAAAFHGGIIQQTAVGIFTLDGHRGFHGVGRNTDQAQRFLCKRCEPIGGEFIVARYRALAKQRERLAALAVKAITEKKYVSAKRLCELAADREREICDIRAGTVRYYRITGK